MVGAVAGLALSTFAVAAQDVKGNEPAPAAIASSQDAPELRPGEIVIKRTGRTKRVAAARRDPSASQPPAAAARPVAEQPAAEDSSDKPGPRSVTIGYTVREPLEQGWGPQVYAPASPYLPNGRYGCDYYGYNSYLPSYGRRAYGGYGYGGGCRVYGGGSYGGFGYGGGVGSYRSYGGYGSFGSRSSFATPSAPITYARRAK
jgi:hypothetical protein